MFKRTLNLYGIQAGFAQSGHLTIDLPMELSHKERLLIEEWLTHNTRVEISPDLGWIQINGTESNTMWMVTVDLEITASGLVTLRVKDRDPSKRGWFLTMIRNDDQVEVLM